MKASLSFSLDFAWDSPLLWLLVLLLLDLGYLASVGRRMIWQNSLRGQRQMRTRRPAHRRQRMQEE